MIFSKELLMRKESDWSKEPFMFMLFALRKIESFAFISEPAVFQELPLI